MTTPATTVGASDKPTDSSERVVSRELYVAHARAPGFYELLDGPHGEPEGVAKAIKLYERIFGDDGPWVMVEVLSLPDFDPPINEAAADTCRALIEHSESGDRP